MTITSTGLLNDGMYVIGGQNCIITNAGNVLGAGIYLFQPASITNQSGGRISGTFGIFEHSRYVVTVVNAGIITGNPASATGFGIRLDHGGSVTNLSSGTIAGHDGIYNFFDSLTVVNAGSIDGDSFVGIHIDGGSVTNQSSGRISGPIGIAGYDGAIVVNAGHIVAYSAGGQGVGLWDGGSVTNLSGGTISGADAIAGGPNGGGAGLVVVNAGCLIGTQDAVEFAAGYTNRLIIDPGAVFSGIVTGGNAIGAAHVSTLELASGAAAGTLASIGTQFIDFGRTTIDAAASWTLTGVNDFVAGSTWTNSGTLTDAGVLTNAGNLNGALVLAAGAVLTNAMRGTISVSSGAAVNVGAGGSVADQVLSTISGYDGIAGSGAGVTVSGDGNILGNLTAASGRGVDLAAGGNVTQGGTISGHDGVYGGGGGALTVTNTGNILGNLTSASGRGVDLVAGGSVSNQNAWISGYDGVYGGGGGALTVTNTGDILGNLTSASGRGVDLVAGGSVSNQSHATISGYDGVCGGAGGALTATNAGSIAGNMTSASGRGVGLVDGGSVTNQSGASISGYDGVYGSGSGALTVTNAGQIAGNATATSGRGVGLAAGGSVTNRGGATISGYDGISAANIAVVVVNAGRIAGNAASGTGVYLGAGGSVTNQTGATISGISGVVDESFGTLTVVNYGDIAENTKYGVGVALDGGGSVTNQSGATMSGYNGIIGSAANVVNAGSIAGSASYGVGVNLGPGSSVTNQSGASISGGFAGIEGAQTVVNAGTISARQSAVLFGYGYANRLIIDPGAVFSGTVEGGNTIGATAASTLELAPGPSAGTLTSLGTQFVDFGLTTIDSGAAWTLGGANYVVTGSSLIDGGTLTNAGSLSGGLTLAAGAVLTNGSTATVSVASGVAVYGLASGPATIVNAGMIVSPNTTAGYYGISLAGGGSVSNESSGTISGYCAISGGTTVVNAGSISGGGNYAVQFAAGAADRLVIDPGATFSGIVNSGNTIGATAVSTLELASAAGAGTLSGLGTQFVDFAQTTIDAGAAWALAGANTIVAGAALTELGGASVSDTGTLENDGAIVLDPSTLTVAALTGTGSVTLDTGSTLEVQGTIAAGETLVFAGSGAFLQLDDPDSAACGIINCVAGETIDLKGIDPATVTFSAGQLTFGGGGDIPLTLSGGGTVFVTSSADGAEVSALCFCANTMLLTPTGERPVQALAVGELVTTHRGEARPIVWIGIGKVLATRGRRNAATPVIVHKSALAENVPNRALRVTKGHSFWFDGVLIPVEYLVNHRTIAWDDRAQEVELYHIELASHDVLVANGAPAESYRDDGNRWLFRNANTGWELPPQAPCAPVLTGGPVVDAVWRRLLQRAGRRPGFAVTDDPDLHLLVDGKRVDARERHGTAYCFRLPGRPGSLRIVSRAGAPAELGLARDPRVLGVALRRIALQQGKRCRVIGAADAGLAVGFHRYEEANGVRWTDGDAMLPAALFAGFDGPMELVLYVGGAARYPLLTVAASQAAA